MASRSHARRRPGAQHPISLRFPPALRRRAERFATKSHLGLATAIRTIVGEYLDEIEAREGLTRAQEWQRAQAWTTAQDLRKKEIPEASFPGLRRDQAEALSRLARRRRG